MEMTPNRKSLEHLFATEGIDLRRSALFDTPPPALPPSCSFDRIEGMMLGIAIGDALGITTEGWLPGDRRRVHGEIRNYLSNKYVADPIGFPSDDSQLAFWTLEQLLTDGSLDPERLVDRFCQDRIFGIGRSVKEALANRRSGKPWHECGARSAGNGALMRIAPMLIPYLPSPSSELWVDVALSAMVTHNDSGSTAACLAFVRMLWDLLCMKECPPPVWWVERYVETARDLETSNGYRPRGGSFLAYQGPIWRFVEEVVPAALERGLSVVEAGDLWYSGAYLLETVPSVLYVLMRHGDDPEEAIIRAVNDTRDNDTIAAIVGAAVGALHGTEKLPARWIEGLAGRTTDRDDGRVFELLAQSKARWG